MIASVCFLCLLQIVTGGMALRTWSTRRISSIFAHRSLKRGTYIVHLSSFFSNALKVRTYCQLIAFAKYSHHLPGCYLFPPRYILTKSHKQTPRIMDLPPPTLIHCKMGMNRSAAVWMAVVAALSSWPYAERIIQAIGRAPNIDEAYQMFCCIAD
jgi:hypothetical protein